MKPRNVTQDLARMEMMRATAFKVAAAFADLANTVPANQGAALFAAQARRIHKCASSLYVAIVRPKDGEPYLKVSNRGSCHCKFCPVCARRMSFKQRQLMHALLDIMYARHPGGLRFKLLTITLRNVPMQDCAAMFAHLSHATKKLMEHPRIATAHKGYWFAFECPVRGTETAPEAGWHAHGLLATDATSAYIDFEEWRRIYRACARVPYDPMIRIEEVRAGPHDSPHDAATHACAELAKYICSPITLRMKPQANDLFDDPKDMPWVVNPEALRWLALTIHKKRLHRYSGMWANALIRHRKGWQSPPQFGDDTSPSPPPF